MIRLEVEDYCSNCPEFDPDVDRVVTECKSFDGDDCITIVDTIVTCEHKLRCNSIKKYMESHKKGEKTIMINLTDEKEIKDNNN